MPWRWRAALWAALAGLYWPLHAAAPLERDDRALLRPLQALGSLADYWGNPQIADLQPLRDLSLWIDLQLGWPHVTNLLLWFAILGALEKLLARSFPQQPVWMWVIPFACHPLFAGSVGWISARKHLLALLFLLLATTWEARPRRAALLYTCSLLAQPIGVLWPLWMWMRGQRKTAAWCGAVAGIVGAFNLYYYETAYLALAERGKWADAPWGAGVLALGRYSFNMVCPGWLATTYNPGSWQNLGGLILLGAAVLWTVRRQREAGLWWAAWALGLAPVTLRPTNIFASDTYALWPAVAALHVLCMFRPRASGWAWIAAVFALATAWNVRAWTSDRALWAHAAAVEPGPLSLSRHADSLRRDGQFDAAWATALRVAEWDPYFPDLGQVLGSTAYAHPGWSDGERLARLSAQPSSPWVLYYQGALLARLGDNDAALHHYRAALDEPARFGREIEVVTAEAVLVCHRAGAQGCASLYENARAQVPSWSEPRYQARLR
jgi:hypothetical protein